MLSPSPDHQGEKPAPHPHAPRPLGFTRVSLSFLKMLELDGAMGTPDPIPSFYQRGNQGPENRMDSTNNTQEGLKLSLLTPYSVLKHVPHSQNLAQLYQKSW